MRKLVMVLMVVMLTAGAAFASGDKNRGDKGKGTVSTGSSAQGAGTQSRTGR